MIYGCLQPRELWFIDFNHVFSRQRLEEMQQKVEREQQLLSHRMKEVPLCTPAANCYWCSALLYTGERTASQAVGGVQERTRRNENSNNRENVAQVLLDR